MKEEIINYKEKYESLLKEFERYKKESIHYTIQDIIESSSLYEITTQEAQRALEDMVAHVDKNEGINSTTFEDYLEAYGYLIEDEDDYEDDYEDEEEEDFQDDDQIIM